MDTGGNQTSVEGQPRTGRLRPSVPV